MRNSSQYLWYHSYVRRDIRAEGLLRLQLQVCSGHINIPKRESWRLNKNNIKLA